MYRFFIYNFNHSQNATIKVPDCKVDTILKYGKNEVLEYNCHFRVINYYGPLQHLPRVLMEILYILHAIVFVLQMKMIYATMIASLLFRRSWYVHSFFN
jgi:hypothetical protein